jgi:hypothetical protein
MRKWRNPPVNENSHDETCKHLKCTQVEEFLISDFDREYRGRERQNSSEFRYKEI